MTNVHNKRVFAQDKLRVYRPDLGCWQIELTRGMWTLVDPCDLHLADLCSWKAFSTYDRHSLHYAVNSRYGRLHRMLMKPKPGEVVDHINGDSLDNRRQNLRVCTQTQNIRNSRKRAAKNPAKASQYRGVHKFVKKDYIRWVAMIMWDGKKKNLGYYLTQEEAARAYDSAAKKYHGEFANLNFPEED